MEHEQENQRGSGPGVCSGGLRGQYKFSFAGPAGAEIKERDNKRNGNEAQGNTGEETKRWGSVEIDGNDLRQRRKRKQVGLEMELGAFDAVSDDQQQKRKHGPGDRDPRRRDFHKG